MGVYIKDLWKPEYCDVCPIHLVFKTCRRDPEHCMFQDVPEPHGRLIDADAMVASIKRQTGFLKIMGGDLATIAEILEKGILQEIENAPTIIPASKEGE